MRKYSGEQELIWGDDNCSHEWNAGIIKHDNMRHRGESLIVGNERNKDIHPGSEIHHSFCSLCGAWKGAYGLEPTPEMYIQHTIEILRETRRVLRKDGVVFWNIGDSYMGSGGDYKEGGKNDAGFQGNLRRGVQKKQQKHSTLKPKDLCLIPFRVAIAAQEDGWWVRSVIIWNKPNPMPEGVIDRPTESHEYILMLTKSAKYYWDLEAVREPYSPTERWGGDTYKGAIKKGLEGEDAGLDRERNCFPNTGRNIRTVWEFPTQPYPEAHFAVFPEKLPEICIKAATPEVGCCIKCGKPWERIVEQYGKPTNLKRGKWDSSKAYFGSEQMSTSGKDYKDVGYTTLGWRPICKCNAAKGQSTILDPFAGAGTTLWVAKKLGCKAVGYELSSEYCDLIIERNRQQALELS